MIIQRGKQADLQHVVMKEQKRKFVQDAEQKVEIHVPYLQQEIITGSLQMKSEMNFRCLIRMAPCMEAEKENTIVTAVVRMSGERKHFNMNQKNKHCI